MKWCWTYFLIDAQQHRNTCIHREKKHPLTLGSLQQDGRFEKQFVPCWNEWMTAGFINITRKQNLEVIFVAEIKTTNQQCFIGWADFFKLQVSIGSTGNPKQESWLVTLRRLGNRSIQQKSHGERSNKKNTPGSTNSDSWLGNPPHPWMSNYRCISLWKNGWVFQPATC